MQVLIPKYKVYECCKSCYDPTLEDVSGTWLRICNTRYNDQQKERIAIFSASTFAAMTALSDANYKELYPILVYSLPKLSVANTADIPSYLFFWELPLSKSVELLDGTGDHLYVMAVPEWIDPTDYMPEEWR